MPLYALCPFFLYEKKNKFGCEAQVMQFSTSADKRAFMRTWCCSWDYSMCEIAKKHLKEVYNDEQDTSCSCS